MLLTFFSQYIDNLPSFLFNLWQALLFVTAFKSMFPSAGCKSAPKTQQNKQATLKVKGNTTVTLRQGCETWPCKLLPHQIQTMGSLQDGSLQARSGPGSSSWASSSSTGATEVKHSYCSLFPHAGIHSQWISVTKNWVASICPYCALDFPALPQALRGRFNLLIPLTYDKRKESAAHELLHSS